MPPIAITRSRYPQQPGRDTNRLYSQLFDEAQYLNRSRGTYKGIVERQRTHIAELQGELQQFSDDMALSLQQKAELNKILLGYADVIGELERAGSTLEDAFEQNGSWGLFSVSALVEAVRAFIQTFRLAIHQAKEVKKTKVLEGSRVDS